MSGPLQELRQRLAEISDLSSAVAVLDWDQQTMMPERAAPLRAEQLGTLSGIVHERATDEAIGRLLHQLEGEEEALRAADPDSDDAALIRVARRDYEKSKRVPAELAVEMARAGALGHQAWVQARARSDFAAFLPFLQRNVELKRQYVELFADESPDDPYDVLLDDYEEGMKTAEVAALFSELRAALVPLIARIAERADAVDNAPLHGDFEPARQAVLLRGVLERLGWSPDGWRLDEAAHPFATSFGPTDVRLTTRYDPSYIGMSLYGAIHEMGHGLYEASVAPQLARTPLAGGVSLGWHESQSRLWENVVGRGRPFAGFLHGELQRTFPERFSGVDADQFYRAVNRVQPSLIRVEADEATYGLHIILRFELEREMLSGALDLKDLPEAWNARMKEYLGVDVPDDADGVLQDVHWSAGEIGYFSTYALGNLIAAQLWQKARTDLPDLDAQLAAGDGAALRAWLGEQLHRYGRKLPPKELQRRVLGGPIQVQPFVDYLTTKLTPLYGLS
ncbi:carboxypeptidase M32 [Conexibacter sp. JD483]|uniref:carboxypeptidase M32 n=1 Tax=unclassified Conexibacter TaxID=2627773 RepID=UPI00271DEC69|nr:MULTISPECIES: carboxypeptidase M32 [unclassified Conexibacter]MDO8185890.1 carboxypeptidase M32 [Conexibacter sp. CPCC 205706]MDO8199381.1 carboxypeptidase M32 [Conexibacter sp. CPCC 205762]MDR9371281.1 carboxypeptidase M32 [Conexibacter sp. JD483]